MAEEVHLQKEEFLG